MKHPTLDSPMELAQIGHPTANYSGGMSTSDILRAAKFEIVSRPNRGPAIWRRRNMKKQWTLFTEDEALALCGRGPRSERK